MMNRIKEREVTARKEGRRRSRSLSRSGIRCGKVAKERGEKGPRGENWLDKNHAKPDRNEKTQKEKRATSNPAGNKGKRDSINSSKTGQKPPTVKTSMSGRKNPGKAKT